MGLMGVVSLPRAFVFRIDLADPHPTPWLRVKLSAAMGQALYPHPQWDVPLWVMIRKSTDAPSFDRYLDYMNWVFCGDPLNPDNTTGTSLKDDRRWFDKVGRRALPFIDTDAYRNVKAATEAFVMANCEVFPQFTDLDSQYVRDQVVLPINRQTLEAMRGAYLEPFNGATPGMLPYLALIRTKLADQGVKTVDIGDVVLGAPPKTVEACYGLIRQRLANPCLLELIWSYWNEEGMLVQTMNAIARRFQNMRAPAGSDPLANLEIDPLRPLNNVFWGYIQDEQHRLSVVRRNYEYDHHYGLRLAGKAVQDMRAADSRSKFLEAFHTLLSVVAALLQAR